MVVSLSAVLLELRVIDLRTKEEVVALPICEKEFDGMHKTQRATRARKMILVVARCFCILTMEAVVVDGCCKHTINAVRLASAAIDEAIY